MTVITFKPKQVSNRLLSVLPERTRDILVQRYGLSDGERSTLEAIGQTYGITRERVRQIENFALNTIRKSDTYQKETPAFEELKNVVISLGGVVAEDDLLSHVTKDPNTQNHVHLFLVLGDTFQRQKEDDQFKHRWVVDNVIAQKVHQSLQRLHESLSDEDLISESEIISRFLGYLKDVSEEYKNEEIAKRWLSISKKVQKNPLGEWGIAESPNIKARGMRDYAFLVIRRHGNPMHFTEVAKEIEKSFGKKAHVATCHNELIKDPRFVLVGRGLYALSSWGYSSGIVRDVIADILKKNGPLPKQDIVDKVLKERYVKPNTIVVNLQDVKYFKKNKDGSYTLV
ncbi:MAG: sigma factor-like helix-turn-helix DNA-binding protein [Patescibacteria group bacterium]